MVRHEMGYAQKEVSNFKLSTEVTRVKKTYFPRKRSESAMGFAENKIELHRRR